MTQQVPLRNGIGGPIIGFATFQDDGTIIAQVTDENFSGLITADRNEHYSIAQHQEDVVDFLKNEMLASTIRAYVCPGCLISRCERVEHDIPHCVCCASGHVE